MGNKIAGMLGFGGQAPADKIYRAGPGQLYATVQDAIDAAEADLHTSNDNPALVEVYPGTYNESLTLKPGISLISPNGVGAGALNADGTGGLITIIGNHTYSVSNGLTRAQNSISISGINLSCLNGVLLTFAGTAPAQLSIAGLTMQKQTGGDVNPALQTLNTGSGSRVRFQNGASIDHNVATSDVMDIQQGTVEMRDRNTGIFSTNNVTLRTAAKISNSAQLRVWSCDNWTTGNFTQVVELVNTTSLFQMFHSLFLNTLAGGHGVLYTAAATARFRWCFISINNNTAGYIGKNGGSGGTWQQGSNSIIGTNLQIQTGITVNTDPTGVVPTP